MVGIKIEQNTICGLMATDQSFYTRFYYSLLYWVKHTQTTIPIRRTKVLQPVGYSLYGEAPPEWGTFFRLQVYERVRIPLVEVYERVGRVGKSVIWVCKRTQKG